MFGSLYILPVQLEFENLTLDKWGNIPTGQLFNPIPYKGGRAKTFWSNCHGKEVGLDIHILSVCMYVYMWDIWGISPSHSKNMLVLEKKSLSFLPWNKNLIKIFVHLIWARNH